MGVHGRKASREIAAAVAAAVERLGASIVGSCKTAKGHTALTIETPSGARRQLIVGASTDWRAIRNTEALARRLVLTT